MSYRVVRSDSKNSLIDFQRLEKDRLYVLRHVFLSDRSQKVFTYMYARRRRILTFIGSVCYRIIINYNSFHIILPLRGKMESCRMVDHMCVYKGTRQSALPDLRWYGVIVTRVNRGSKTKDYGKRPFSLVLRNFFLSTKDP